LDVVGAPGRKGTTPAAEEAADPPTGCKITCAAMMVVPLVVPSTTTSSPVAITIAEIELTPAWYVVEVVSSTVTF
jgi:hypothetical protein